MKAFILAAVLICTALLLSNVDLFNSDKQDKVIDVHDIDLGKVINVRDCQDWFYSTECTIQSEIFTLEKIDINEFPNNTVVMGDHIGVRLSIYSNRVERRHFQNGEFTHYDTCYNWMPCRNNYPTPS